MNHRTARASRLNPARLTPARLMRAMALPLMLAGLAAGLVTGVVTEAHAQTAMSMARLRGTIVSVSDDTLTVQPKMGDKVALHLEKDTRVAGVSQADIADIKPNSYVGTAAVSQPDGTLRAIEVHVFDESMRGAGDGHRAWDLGDNSSMTNGTVGDLVVSQGRTITVRYKNGEQKIVVPADAPVVRITPGDRTLLAPGAHVLLFAKRNDDGSLTAQTISVGKQGLVPPM